MRKLLLLLLVFIGASSFQSNSKKIFDLSFEANVEELSLEAEEQLENIIDQLQNITDDYEVNLEVFPVIEEQLNRKRVENITDYLWAEGIKVDRVIFYSKKEDAASELPIQSDWNFIRLTFETFPEASQEIAATSKIPTITGNTANSNNTANRGQNIPKWAKPVVNYTGNVKTFSIQNHSDVKLRLRGGSFIEIEAESFVYEDGTSVEEEINIVTKLANTKALAILDELTTLNNGKLLESRGMIYMNAETKSGRPVKLAEGKSFTINVKTEDYDEGFSAYEAEQNKMTGMTNWLLSENPKVEDKVVNKDVNLYKYRRMSLKERAEVKRKRKDQIKRWEEMNIPDNIIKKRLKNYRKLVRKKEKRIRKRHRKNRGKYHIRRVSRGEPIIRAREYIGNIRWKYKYVKTVYKMNRYYKVNSFTMGWHNIDRLLNQINIQKTRKLFIKARPNANVKIIFTNLFTIIKGIPKDGGYYFEDVPNNTAITILAATQKDDGTIDVNYKSCNSSDNNLALQNSRNVTESGFVRMVKRLVP